MERLERTTSAVRIILKEGIARVVGLGAPHSPETVQEMAETLLDLTDGRRIPILFDVRNWGPIGPTSWAEFIRRIEEICPAAAVVGEIRPFDKAYVGVYPTIIDSLVVPFRVFDEEAAALEFLTAYAES